MKPKHEVVATRVCGTMCRIVIELVEPETVQIISIQDRKGRPFPELERKFYNLPAREAQAVHNRVRDILNMRKQK